MARRALQLFKRKSLGEMGLYVIARTGGRFTIGLLDGNRRARRRLQRERQIVERVLVLKSRQRPLVVTQQSCGRTVQACIDRNAAFNERQRLTVQRFLNIGWRNVSRAIAKRLIVASAAVMLFVGMQDDNLTGMRSSFSATIREALNAAQRDADCIGVVAMGSVRLTGKTSLYAVNVARRLNKPVFARPSQFKLTAIARVSRNERRPTLMRALAKLDANRDLVQMPDIGNIYPTLRTASAQQNQRHAQNLSHTRKPRVPYAYPSHGRFTG